MEGETEEEMATKRSVGTPGPQGPQEQNVFLRADLNILLDDDRNITEDNRIRASVPSVPFLKFLMGKAAKVILANNLKHTEQSPLSSPCELLLSLQ